jgi:hypothetical protein
MNYFGNDKMLFDFIWLDDHIISILYFFGNKD